jgi:hypothetical protein
VTNRSSIGYQERVASTERLGARRGPLWVIRVAFVVSANVRFQGGSGHTELEKVGHEAVTAKALLVVFEATNAFHIADRDQIAAEIAALD